MAEDASGAMTSFGPPQHGMYVPASSFAHGFFPRSSVLPFPRAPDFLWPSHLSVHEHGHHMVPAYC